MNHTLIFSLLFWALLSCSKKENKAIENVVEKGDQIENSPPEIPKKDSIEKITKPNKQNQNLNIENLENELIAQGLVNIQDVDPSIIVQLKYSTTDNFFGKDVYGDLKNAYLQKKVAEQLKKVNQALKADSSNLRLVVYDAVRPQRVQYILWNSLDTIPPATRKNYVADPNVGSIHNYGCAVDLSIFDVNKNKAIDMGTKYDYFGALAYPRKEDEMLKEGKLSQTQVNNRLLLRNLMKRFGFMPITSEWWHFNYMSRNQAKQVYQIVR